MAGTAQIIEANFSKPYAIIYLAVVSAAILVCCLSIMTATIRLCFGMSRDNRLPRSAALSRVHPKLHTPILSCIVVAILAAIPLLKYTGAGIVAIAATAMIYLSYFLGNLAVFGLVSRDGRGEDAVRAWQVGMLINILALCWGARC